MADRQEKRSSTETHLEQVVELLHRHELVENLVHRQEGTRQELVETLVHRQHLNELQQLLDRLHPADIAYILEALPRDQRLVSPFLGGIMLQWVGTWALGIFGAVVMAGVTAFSWRRLDLQPVPALPPEAAQ